MRCAYVVVVAAFLPLMANAKSVAMPNRGGYAQPPCIDGMAKTANININFNGQADSLVKAQEAFMSQKKEMEAEAKKFGEDKVQLNNYNYSLNMNYNYNNGTQMPMFNFSGNLSYQVSGEDVAMKISTRLAELKRQFSMSLNANRCQEQVGRY
jgi:hypothetical protein